MGAPHADLEAQNVIAQELAEVEAEAMSWRLRCLQAEAKLRIQRQRRRRGQRAAGDGAPARWPEDAQSLEALKKRQCDLEAEVRVLEANRAKPLRSLVAARVAAESAGTRLRQKLEEMQEGSGSQFQAAVVDISESLALEASTYPAGTADLGEERIAELQQKEVDLRRELELAQQGQTKLFDELEEERPRLQQLESEAASALSELEHSQAVASRRAAVVAATEAENAEVLETLEKRLLSEQMQLEDCRTELRDVDENTLEATEQAKKAKLGHGHQLEVVRQGGAALREALADSQVEHGDRAKEVSRLREIVDELAARHNQQLAVERKSAMSLTELEQDLQQQAERLGVLREEHEVASQESTEASAQLSESLSRCRAASQEHIAAASQSTEAEALLARCQSQLQRLCDEFGEEAIQKRSKLLEVADRGAEKLREALASVSESCEEARGGSPVKDLHKDRLLIARQASQEAILKLKASYTEFAKELRISSKLGGWTDVAGNAAKGLRRIGKNLDDLLRFLETEAAWALKVAARLESADTAREAGAPLEPQPAELMKLPQCLTEAYAALSTDRGPKCVWLEEMLSAERHKVQLLHKKLTQASKSHETEMRRLAKHTEELSEQLATCELELEAAQRLGKESQEGLEVRLRDMLLQQTQVHLGGVEEIQQQLWNTVEAHSTDQAALRTERNELLSKLQATGPAGAGPEPTSTSTVGQEERQLKQVEAEVAAKVRELHGRKAMMQSTYKALVMEAGGREAVEEAGLTVPLSPREFTGWRSSSSPALDRVAEGADASPGVRGHNAVQSPGSEASGSGAGGIDQATSEVSTHAPATERAQHAMVANALAHVTVATAPARQTTTPEEAAAVAAAIFVGSELDIEPMSASEASPLPRTFPSIENTVPSESRGTAFSFTEAGIDFGEDLLGGSHVDNTEALPSIDSRVSGQIGLKWAHLQETVAAGASEMVAAAASDRAASLPSAGASVGGASLLSAAAASVPASGCSLRVVTTGPSMTMEAASVVNTPAHSDRGRGSLSREAGPPLALMASQASRTSFGSTTIPIPVAAGFPNPVGSFGAVTNASGTTVLPSSRMQATSSAADSSPIATPVTSFGSTYGAEAMRPVVTTTRTRMSNITAGEVPSPKAAGAALPSSAVSSPMAAMHPVASMKMAAPPPQACASAASSPTAAVQPVSSMKMVWSAPPPTSPSTSPRTSGVGVPASPTAASAPQPQQVTTTSWQALQAAIQASRSRSPSPVGGGAPMSPTSPVQAGTTMRSFPAALPMPAAAGQPAAAPVAGQAAAPVVTVPASCRWTSPSAPGR